jgi:DNA invertase Pin-like site-specific DNA recombinase
MQAEREFNSCESQFDKIKSFINSQENMEVFKVYSDPGFTGANTNRPALQELLQDLKNNRINLVIAYKIDRLTRSPKDFYQLIELFEKYGVNFISVTERFDTSTPSGRLLRNIMLTFAQFERELASERTRDKLLQRAEKGLWNGGIVPYGYKRENKRLVVYEPEADNVKVIFKTYLLSRSLVSVYEKLKTIGVTYRSGKPFLKTAISYILHNPIYTGKVKYAGKTTQGIHQPIISEEIFEQAQKIHKDKKRTMKLYKNFALAGLIRCKECNSHMTPSYTNKRNGRKLKRYYYYRCTDTFKREWGSCSTKQVSADRLEDYIFDNLERISLDKQYLDNLCFSFNHRPEGGLPSKALAKDGRIGVPHSSKNPAKNPLARYRSGLEQREEPLKISAEIFAQTLAVLTKSFFEKKGIEKNLLAKKFIQSIQYSKNSIKLNLFSSVSGSSSILPQKEKIRSKGAENSKNLVRNERNGCPAWARTR